MESERDIPDVYAPPIDQQNTPRAVYIHVPFCLHRCGYCDFTLVAQQDDLIPSWLKALANEMDRLDRKYAVDSIFVGGGTPTHLTPDQLQQLQALIDEHFTLNDGGEFTFEANPDGLDAARLVLLCEMGVNRLSMGIQSFDDGVLQTLERQHTGAQAEEAVHRASEFIPNLSLDLIFGVPGQSQHVWNESLETASRLPLTHISTYGLTYEKGTDFFRRRRDGELVALDEELERGMYAAGIEFLRGCGFTHYEVSNFAKPSHQCRHNLVYWSADSYFAFGPGAARYVNKTRSTNSRNVVRWINSWLANKPALQDWETLSHDARTREAIFLGLRMCEGIELASFERRFGISIAEFAPEPLRRHTDLSNVEILDGRFRLTSEGRFVADSVVTDFL